MRMHTTAELLTFENLANFKEDNETCYESVLRGEDSKVEQCFYVIILLCTGMLPFSYFVCVMLEFSGPFGVFPGASKCLLMQCLDDLEITGGKTI